MKDLFIVHRSVVFISMLALLFGLVLSACDGTAVIDVNFDATEGVGNVVISGDQNQPDQAEDESGDVNLSQILLFGLVVALLLGTVAIVISLSRRPRPE